MDPHQVSHGAYVLAFDPRIETAMWAILLAVGCALIVVLTDMVKDRR